MSKSTKPAGRRPRKRPATFRLPTVSAFAKMSLHRRQALFIRWVKAQPRNTVVDVWNSLKCPMARFAQALYKSPMAACGAYHILFTGTQNNPIQFCKDEDRLDRAIYQRQPTTLGELADELTLP